MTLLLARLQFVGRRTLKASRLSKWNGPVGELRPSMWPDWRECKVPFFMLRNCNLSFAAAQTIGNMYYIRYWQVFDIACPFILPIQTCLFRSIQDPTALVQSVSRPRTTTTIESRNLGYYMTAHFLRKVHHFESAVQRKIKRTGHWRSKLQCQPLTLLHFYEKRRMDFTHQPPARQFQGFALINLYCTVEQTTVLRTVSVGIRHTAREVLSLNAHSFNAPENSDTLYWLNVLNVLILLQSCR